VEAVEVGHRDPHILAAVTVLLAVGSPEAGNLVVCLSVSPSLLHKPYSCRTDILGVGHSSLAVEGHNFVVVGERRNTVVVVDSHAVAPGRERTTFCCSIRARGIGGV